MSIPQNKIALWQRYDASDRKREFQPHWLKQFSWLNHNYKSLSAGTATADPSFAVKHWNNAGPRAGRPNFVTDIGGIEEGSDQSDIVEVAQILNDLMI